LKDSVSHDSITINSLTADQPHKTLGHWKLPAGKLSKQLKEIQKKAKRSSMLIGTSPIPRDGAKMAYMAKYIASLQYVLPQQCTFSHKDLR
jgi:hypothetical protein